MSANSISFADEISNANNNDNQRSTIGVIPSGAPMFSVQMSSGISTQWLGSGDVKPRVERMLVDNNDDKLDIKPDISKLSLKDQPDKWQTMRAQSIGGETALKVKEEAAVAETKPQDHKGTRSVAYINKRIIFGKRVFKHPIGYNSGPAPPEAEPIGDHARLSRHFRRRYLRELADCFEASTGKGRREAYEAAQREERSIAEYAPHSGLYIWRMKKCERKLREDYDKLKRF